MALKQSLITAQRGLIRRADAFRHNESGATSIEYSLIVSLIFLAIIAAVRQFTNSTSDMYGTIEDAMAEANE